MSMRSTVSNIGAGVLTESYLIDDSTIKYDSTKSGGSAQVGLAVTLSDDYTVQLVGDGEAVIGKLILVESDGVCAVQVKGNMTLPGGSGATLTLGSKIVGDLGAASAEGYVRAVASAQAAELAVARGQILDASVTTAVVVRL